MPRRVPARVAAALDVRPDEAWLRLAAQVGPLLWLGAGAVVLLLPALPGRGLHETAVLAIGAAGFAYGVAMHLVARRGMSYPVHLAGAILGAALIAALAAATGGADSPARSFIWFALAYVALVFSTRVALLYVVLCALIRALPLIYQHDAIHENVWRELFVAVPVQLMLALAILAGRAALERRKRELQELGAAQRRLAAEQGSLRRVATAVAAGTPPQAIFQLVAVEAARLLNADSGGVVRFDAPGSLRVMGTWAQEVERYETGMVVTMPTGAEPWATARRGRIGRYEIGPDSADPAREHGFRLVLAAPVHHADRVWGAIAVATRDPSLMPPDCDQRLEDYADLTATALANAEERALLDEQAGIDRLTALPNHRSFDDRLGAETSRAKRHGAALSAAVLDIDGLAALADQSGQEASDQVLAEVADALRSVARGEDVVARLAPGEFGLLLIEADERAAYAIAERARKLAIEAPICRRLGVTVSAGVCDLDNAGGAELLLAHARAAVRWSRVHGHDATWIYDPAVAGRLEDEGTHAEADRLQALAGLRALARAIDAKEPTTREHSERVARLTASMARERGWAEERIAALREAALLHDVGKAGVPEEVLLKPGALTPEEYLVIKQHAQLGARLVADVLTHEQAGWIEAHHERPDGAGYPRGLHAGQIPEGAALLSLADAWDVMTGSRWYSPAREHGDALAEVRRLRGLQFTDAAVDALEALHERGELTSAAARLFAPTD